MYCHASVTEPTPRGAVMAWAAAGCPWSATAACAIAARMQRSTGRASRACSCRRSMRASSAAAESTCGDTLARLFVDARLGGEPSGDAHPANQRCEAGVAAYPVPGRVFPQHHHPHGSLGECRLQAGERLLLVTQASVEPSEVEWRHVPLPCQGGERVQPSPSHGELRLLIVLLGPRAFERAHSRRLLGQLVGRAQAAERSLDVAETPESGREPELRPRIRGLGLCG